MQLTKARAPMFDRKLKNNMSCSIYFFSMLSLCLAVARNRKGVNLFLEARKQPGLSKPWKRFLKRTSKMAFSEPSKRFSKREKNMGLLNLGSVF